MKTNSKTSADNEHENHMAEFRGLSDMSLWVLLWFRTSKACAKSDVAPCWMPSSGTYHFQTPQKYFNVVDPLNNHPQVITISMGGIQYTITSHGRFMAAEVFHYSYCWWREPLSKMYPDAPPIYLQRKTWYPHDFIGVAIAEAVPRERQRPGFTALPAATGAGRGWNEMIFPS